MPPEPDVGVGRVHDPRDGSGRPRVLVDRLWPRGLSRSRADLDRWCRDVAPSTELRSWYGHAPDRFAEFARRYRTELEEPARAAALQELLELSRSGGLLLLTATRDPSISQAAVLADLLRAGG